MSHWSMRLALSLGIASLSLVPGATVAQAPARPAAAAHQRFLPLEGGQNFRDLGGYRAADGRTVKWGLLYRSGAMNTLTVKDYATLQALGIRTVCDFRSTPERTQAAVNWPEGARPAIFADDYELEGSFTALMRPRLTGAQAAEVMTATYREIPARFAGQYRRMFAELVAGRAPLAFNCSAGKDRTGVAAALLLTALGVPYATVREDYLLSNQAIRPTKGFATDERTSAFLKQMSPDALKQLMSVDGRYLDAAFAAIRAQPGGLDGYYRDQLGLDARKLKLLRDHYLERG